MANEDVPAVLVVDDQPANRMLFEAQLSSLGCEIVLASSGAEAVRLIAEREFALVVLDVHMPVMSGYEVVRVAREDEKTRAIPFLFVTAMQPSEVNVVVGYDAGAVDYLFKPVNPVILQGKVRVFLELYSTRKALEKAGGRRNGADPRPSAGTASTVSSLERLVGSWTTEATHPSLPGVVVHGTVEMSWLEGQRFLIHRARTDHPDFPDSISVLGVTGPDRAEAVKGADEEAQLRMHYFDSRGVSRVYEASIDEKALRLWRSAPGFSQRFTGNITDGGRTLEGLWDLCEDDVNWKSDLEITYRRRA